MLITTILVHFDFPLPHPRFTTLLHHVYSESVRSQTNSWLRNTKAVISSHRQGERYTGAAARRSALFCKTNPRGSIIEVKRIGGRSFDSEEEPSSTGWKSARNGLIKSAEHEPYSLLLF